MQPFLAGLRMIADPDPKAAPLAALVRHWGGFLVSGATAFCVDAAVLTLLTKGFGLDPLLARLAAISIAMVAGWQCHRRLTFNVRRPSSLDEFATYAGLAWVSAGVNYTLFAAILLIWPALEPVLALVAASLGAMTVSYLGMRFKVFKDPHATD